MRRQSNRLLELAIDKLAKEFGALDLTFHHMADGQPGDVTSYWPGGEKEDILVCVFRGTQIEEPFHRQDFFFINYAYENSYQALSAQYDNLITIREDECYVSQPYGGYALRCNSEQPSIIIGVLVRRDAFFREYLPLVYGDSELFRFFLEPQRNRFSEEFIHLSMTRDHAMRSLLELMVLEYADRREDTQVILKALLQALLVQIARRYRLTTPRPQPQGLAEQIVQYIDAHSADVTLQDLAARFSYHPNYIS
ncbi:MAG: AraC family transcriptional regulator, partial [Oscillospiraceae bacterium]|nr:AraC family transcriptional regulator [Oscillospiraceae bacterium]